MRAFVQEFPIDSFCSDCQEGMNKKIGVEKLRLMETTEINMYY
jgi:hypothetical protein